MRGASGSIRQPRWQGDHTQLPAAALNHSAAQRACSGSLSKDTSTLERPSIIASGNTAQQGGWGGAALGGLPSGMQHQPAQHKLSKPQATGGKLSNHLAGYAANCPDSDTWQAQSTCITLPTHLAGSPAAAAKGPCSAPAARGLPQTAPRSGGYGPREGPRSPPPLQFKCMGSSGRRTGVGNQSVLRPGGCAPSEDPRSPPLCKCIHSVWCSSASSEKATKQLNRISSSSPPPPHAMQMHGRDVAAGT